MFSPGESSGYQIEIAPEQGSIVLEVSSPGKKEMNNFLRSLQFHCEKLLNKP